MPRYQSIITDSTRDSLTHSLTHSHLTHSLTHSLYSLVSTHSLTQRLQAHPIFAINMYSVSALTAPTSTQMQACLRIWGPRICQRAS